LPPCPYIQSIETKRHSPVKDVSAVLKTGSTGQRTLIGSPTAPGLAIGKTLLYRHDSPDVAPRRLEPEATGREIDRFRRALVLARRQVAGLREQLSREAGESAAYIFDAQQMIIDDVEFVGEIESRIRSEAMSAEWVVESSAMKWRERLLAVEGARFHQRAQDVTDIGRRIVLNLLGQGDGRSLPTDGPAILVADDLLPSDVVHLLKSNVIGVAIDLGGAASHTAILTKALEVPAVVGLKDVSRSISPGDSIIVNGNSGKVIVRPETATESEYQAKLDRYLEYLESLKDAVRLPAETLDGHPVALRANIELPQEIESVVKRGGEGVGLFRSEYLLLARRRIPTEDEQYEDYRRVLEAAWPHPVTIRTFDVGGDKIFPEMPLPAEANPFMGWRAVRVSLDHPDILKDQFRAILRAAVHGRARIMLPFVTDPAEVSRARQLLDAARHSLAADGIPDSANVAFGVMIELPSAVMMADEMAAAADFFSIGTNDLTQFTLAVDRGNERVADRYDPLHPAVIRMIRITVEAARRAGITTGICGELAASPTATMLLVGLGLDELSVSPVALPEVKKLIRSFTFDEARAMTEIALTKTGVAELREFCWETMKHRFANLPIWFD